MSELRFRRRNALALAGLGATGALLPSLYTSGDLRAQPRPARRLLVFFTRHGPTERHWQWSQAPMGRSDLSSWSSFTETLKPLERVSNQVTILEGLGQTRDLKLGGGKDVMPHDFGCAGILTGSNVMRGGKSAIGAGSSVEQVAADAIGQTTPIRSLYMRVGGVGPAPISYLGTSLVPPDGGVPEVYARLAGVLPSEVKPVAPGKPQAPDPRLLARASVLDAVARDTARILPRLSAEDRLKLQSHQDFVRRLEQRVAMQAAGGQTVGGAQCGPAAKPVLDGTKAGKAVAAAKLFAAAFACDATRVGLIQLDDIFSGEIPGVPPNSDPHGVIAHYKDEVTMGYNDKSYRHLAEAFASMVDALAAVREGSGTLLDNTSLVWVTEMATGQHALKDMMVVVAGAGGGVFRPGSYIKYPETSHCLLLTSLLHSVGVEAAGFGWLPTCGPLGGLKS